MSEAGPSSAGRRVLTGEFTDDENLDIPLRDIREAEFERLEAGPVTKEVIEEERKQSSRWPIWPLNKRRRSSAGYTKVDDDDAAIPLATNGLQSKETKKASGGVCGGKLVWGILYACPSNMLNQILTSTKYFPHRLQSPLPRCRILHGPDSQPALTLGCSRHHERRSLLVPDRLPPRRAANLLSFSQ